MSFFSAFHALTEHREILYTRSQEDKKGHRVSIVQKKKQCFLGIEKIILDSHMAT